MNWSKDRSIALSRGCVVLFMILLAALDIGCYWAVRWFIGLRFMPWQSGVLMMVTIYLCSGFGWVLLVRLWQLLQNIRAQLVFDAQNVRLLRQNGVVLFLDRPLDALTVGGGRPLSSSVDALRTMYAERRPLYLAAADAVVPNETTVADAVKASMEALDEIFDH